MKHRTENGGPGALTHSLHIGDVTFTKDRGEPLKGYLDRTVVATKGQDGMASCGSHKLEASDHFRRPHKSIVMPDTSFLRETSSIVTPQRNNHVPAIRKSKVSSRGRHVISSIRVNTPGLWILLLVLCTTLIPEIALAGRIWFESGFATITTGFDTRHGQSIERKLYLATYGPDSYPGEIHDVARACTAQYTYAVGEEFRKHLWKIQYPELPDPGKQSLQDSELNEAAKQRYGEVSKLLLQVIETLRIGIVKCSNGRLSGNDFTPAVILRICQSGGVHGCTNAQPRYSDHPSARAFSMALEWLNAKLDPKDASLLTLPANSLVLLFPAQTNDLDVKKPDNFIDTNPWPAEISASARQDYFEAAVTKLRPRQLKFEHSVPRILGLPQEVAIRVLDVIDEPSQALTHLNFDKTASIRYVSDEIARTRILECVKYRGQRQLAEVRACAGYELTQEKITGCITGGRCVPDISKTGWASVIAIAEAHGRPELATAALLPRVAFTKADYDALKKAAQDCRSVANGSQKAMATCVINARLSDQDRKMFDCARQHGTSTASIECATGQALPASTQIAIGCTKKGDARGVACALEAALPASAREILDCQRNARGNSKNAALCTAKALGNKEVALYSACFEDSKDDWQQGALCVMKDKIPKEAAQAIGCIQHGGSTSAIAGCVLTGNLPKELQLPVQCVAEAAGDPVGVGICLAADGLTPDQRIGLQCAMSSGGEPTTFATCTLGRLAVKEFTQCLDKKFGEANCFGENNDIRRLVKNLLGQDIHSGTVAGQFLNAQLEVVKFTVGMAQATSKGLESLVNNASRESERFVQNVGREVERAGQNIAREGGNAIQWFGDRTGLSSIKVPPITPPPPIEAGKIGGTRVCIPWC